MPAYDYACATCGHRFEVLHGIHAIGPEACPACGAATIRKLLTTPAVHFRGSGWAKMERRVAPPATKSGADAGSDSAGTGGTSKTDGPSSPSSDSTPSSGAKGSTGDAATSPPSGSPAPSTEGA